MILLRFFFSKFFIKHLFLLLGLLLIVISVLLFWLERSTHHGEHILVPDVSGMTLEDAISILEDQSLAYAILDTSSYNPNFPYQTIIEQIPQSGVEVKQSRKIHLSINRSGYKSMQVPYVVGKTLRQAQPALISSGFEIGRLIYRRYVAKNEVLAMRYKNRSIKKGDKLPRTSVIDLILGDGKGVISGQVNKDSPYRSLR